MPSADWQSPSRSSLTARAFNLSGISPHDPVSIGAALMVLLAGALTAVLIPARRAARSNPVKLLRRGQLTLHHFPGVTA